ncbi:hypothetical protein TWF696_009531 [Orbilia brochopaga]|uniref:Uncharacterized protein n=1 Tax=Orbilia brochopaga TaxID=3140254 RepID=A0AAV9UD30_9PEZI
MKATTKTIVALVFTFSLLGVTAAIHIYVPAASETVSTTVEKPDYTEHPIQGPVPKPVQGPGISIAHSKNSTSNSLDKRINTQCNDTKDMWCSFPAATACYDMLMNQNPDALITVNYMKPQWLCHFENCTWWGWGEIKGPTASIRRDIAKGGKVILDKCTRGPGVVRGWNAAWGNGDFIVNIEYQRDW